MLVPFTTTNVRRALQRMCSLLCVAGLLGLLALLGCQATLLSMIPAPRAYTAQDYEGRYRAWTRSADNYNFSRLRSVLHVTATFESWEFRNAYVVGYAHDHGLDTETRTGMLRGALADAQQNHRFFVTLAGDNFRESDLTGANTAWRVMLVDERGILTAPASVERVERPTAAERTYFPSVSPHRDAFRIVFPARREDGSHSLPEHSHYVLLRFTGALGTVDLRWNFIPE